MGFQQNGNVENIENNVNDDGINTISQSNNDGEIKEESQDSTIKSTNDKPKEQVVKKAKVDSNTLTQKESMNFKCEYFFGKNWKYVAFFIGISILVFAYELNSISGRMKQLERIVLENNEKVVLTTTDGRAIKVTKEPLKAEYLKMFVVSTFVNNFIVSRSQLTNNFSQVAFKDYGEVLDNVPQIRNILRNFMDYQNVPENNIVVNRIAVGDLRGYVQWLINAVAQDRLPEYIVLKDYSVEKYEYEGDKFTIEVNIRVVTQSYILSRNEYQQGEGTFSISGTGRFYLERSSDVNPYGLRIESLKISPVTKR